jgi:hypothetical protein
MKFRPEDDPHPGSDVEWADNPLSNAFAWGSETITPTWCKAPEHWTSRVTRYLFSDCPCCLLARGVVVGGVLGLAVGAAAASLRRR